MIKTKEWEELGTKGRDYFMKGPFSVLWTIREAEKRWHNLAYLYEIQRYSVTVTLKRIEGQSREYLDSYSIPGKSLRPVS